MTQPVQEPTQGRLDASQEFRTRQLYRRPAPPSGGSGIQFETYPQDGLWLYVETTDSTGSPNGYGTEFVTAGFHVVNQGENSSEVRIENHEDGGTTIFDDGGGGVSIRADSGAVEIVGQDGTMIAADQYSGAATITADWISLVAGSGSGNDSQFTSQNNLILSADGQLTLNGGTTLVMSMSAGSLQCPDSNSIDVYLGSGTQFTFYDSGNNPIFRINENGDLQGKTGKALTFNL